MTTEPSAGLHSLQTDILTPDELSPLLHVHPVTLRREARAGRIPHVRVGRRYLFSSSAVAAWLARGAVREPAPACSAPSPGIAPPAVVVEVPRRGSAADRTARRVCAILQEGTRNHEG